MSARSSRSPHAPLAAALRRFGRWRRTRKPGTRIPEDLWSLAVELAEELGVSRVATELSLDYYKLKDRAEAISQGTALAVVPSTDFVELPILARAQATDCVLELQDDRGVRLRVELSGSHAAEIEAVARALWSSAR